MSSSELQTFFEERLEEVEDFLDLLRNIEEAARSGAPRFAQTSTPISTSQQRILYSSLYLQLYNLVEATVSRSLAAITAAAEAGGWKPDDLNDEMRREWVRSVARTHADLNSGNRLAAAVEMCNHLLSSLPIGNFKIEAGGGGNWDDAAIEDVSARIGCKLYIKPTSRTAAKRAMRNGVGALTLVKNLRNELAHGSLSFAECADGVTVTELIQVASAVTQYLREAVACFDQYVRLSDFLSPARRPSTEGAS